MMNSNTSPTLNMDADINVPSGNVQNSQIKKSKRHRSAFTTEQINYLEKEFKQSSYVGSIHRKEIASILKISEKAVKIWFQNRRMKEKREVKELLFEDKSSSYSAYSKEQLNNRNMFSDNDCSTSKLLLSSQHENKHLKESNIESRNLNYTLNETDKQKGVKSTLSQIERGDTKKDVVETQRNKHINQLNDIKEFKSKEKIPIPLHSKIEHAQDLSIRNTIIDQKDNQRFCPVHSNTDQRFVPLFPRDYFVSQPISTSRAIDSNNVIWKPVSVFSAILPVLEPLSTETIGHNFSETSLNNPDVLKGTCDCHGLQHMFDARAHSAARTQPQYIFAIPFSNFINK